MHEDPTIRIAERLLEWWEAEQIEARAVKSFAVQMYLAETVTRPMIAEQIFEANDRLLIAAQHIRELRGIIEPPDNQ